LLRQKSRTPAARHPYHLISVGAAAPGIRMAALSSDSQNHGHQIISCLFKIISRDLEMIFRL
jgi:hypothetical protein